MVYWSSISLSVKGASTSSPLWPAAWMSRQRTISRHACSPLVRSVDTVTFVSHADSKNTWFQSTVESFRSFVASRPLLPQKRNRTHGQRCQHATSAGVASDVSTLAVGSTEKIIGACLVYVDVDRILWNLQRTTECRGDPLPNYQLPDSWKFWVVTEDWLFVPPKCWAQYVDTHFSALRFSLSEELSIYDRASLLCEV